MLGNGDVRISYVVGAETSPLYRNATGDECVFIESGEGVLETVFGHLPFGPGDYLIVPRATTHRWVPNGDVRAYCIEANSHIGPPRRYLSRFGQLLEHAPYCERDLRGPSEPEVREDEPTEVFIKHRGSGPGGLTGTVHVVPRHPFDVVGWDGCLYPYAFNVADFEPITGRVHQPPPVHQVFEGNNFVICNFVPRKVDYHPLAIPVPYYHSNVDSDEVMFYVAGDYEARKGSGIAQGLDLAAPRRALARAAAVGDRGEPRRARVRRAGGHGRHVPPARARRGRPGVRRRRYAQSWTSRRVSKTDTVTCCSTASSTTRRSSRPATRRWTTPFARTSRPWTRRSPVTSDRSSARRPGSPRWVTPSPPSAWMRSTSRW